MTEAASASTGKSIITEPVILTPSYTLPISIVFLSIPLIFFQIWIGLVISLFGVFLLYQTVTLRLTFTATALDIFRGETLIRRFPYAEWENWRIFWAPVPILFYFKEVNSIHFLPILFNPKELKNALEKNQLQQTQKG